MRILHVVRGLENSSGTTHIVIPLAEEQARQGHEVTVFHVDIPGGFEAEPDPSLVSSQCFPMKLPFRNLGYSPAFSRGLQDRIREFDVIHIHAIWNYPTRETMRLAARAEVPFLVAPQGSLEPWALRHHRLRKWPWMRLVEGPLFQRAATMQALSPAEEAQIRRFGIRAPVCIVPNGIRPESFENAGTNGTLREVLGIPDSQKILLFLGRLHPKKGLDVLAEAFGRFLVTRHDVTLVIAGHDGGSGYQSYVEAILKKNGTLAKARLVGELRGPDKTRALCGADAFVLASYSEGLPIAVLEAMAAGLPVVITPGCNLPEVAEDGAGIITEPECEALKEALLRLFANDQTRVQMGRDARTLVRRKFTWPAIATRTLNVYRNILDGLPPGQGLD